MDCDDGNVAVNPDSAEVCNGLDENCNGVVDEDVETAHYDGDGRQFNDDTSTAPTQHVSKMETATIPTQPSIPATKSA